MVRKKRVLLQLPIFALLLIGLVAILLRYTRTVGNPSTTFTERQEESRHEDAEVPFPTPSRVDATGIAIEAIVDRIKAVRGLKECKGLIAELLTLEEFACSQNAMQLQQLFLCLQQNPSAIVRSLIALVLARNRQQSVFSILTDAYRSDADETVKWAILYGLSLEPWSGNVAREERVAQWQDRIVRLMIAAGYQLHQSLEVEPSDRGTTRSVPLSDMAPYLGKDAMLKEKLTDPVLTFFLEVLAITQRKDLALHAVPLLAKSASEDPRVRELFSEIYFRFPDLRGNVVEVLAKQLDPSIGVLLFEIARSPESPHRDRERVLAVAARSFPLETVDFVLGSFEASADPWRACLLESVTWLPRENQLDSRVQGLAAHAFRASHSEQTRIKALQVLSQAGFLDSRENFSRALSDSSQALRHEVVLYARLHPDGFRLQ